MGSILLVDDEVYMRRILATHLRRDQHRILEASGVEEAQRILAANRRQSWGIAVLGFNVAWSSGGQSLKPGFNLFSMEQDVQQGEEAAAQVRKEKTIINGPGAYVLCESCGQASGCIP